MHIPGNIPDWMELWATWSSWGWLQGVGLDSLYRSPPAQIILWLCGEPLSECYHLAISWPISEGWKTVSSLFPLLARQYCLCLYTHTGVSQEKWPWPWTSIRKSGFSTGCVCHVTRHTDLFKWFFSCVNKVSWKKNKTKCVKSLMDLESDTFEI